MPFAPVDSTIHASSASTKGEYSTASKRVVARPEACTSRRGMRSGGPPCAERGTAAPHSPRIEHFSAEGCIVGAARNRRHSTASLHTERGHMDAIYGVTMEMLAEIFSK